MAWSRLLVNNCALLPPVAQDASGLALSSESGGCHHPHFPGTETEALKSCVWGPRVFRGIFLKELRVRSHGMGLRGEEREQGVYMASEFVHLRLESQHCPYGW